MTESNKSFWWGAGLLALGVLFLLENFGWVDLSGLWGLLFVALGVGFVWAYRQDNSRWWALIPGFTLLGLGSLVVFEGLWGQAGGGFFLLSIALGFWVIFFTQRALWWALIPAGVLTTLAVVAWLDVGGSDVLSGFVFFLGLTLTFVALFFRGQRWAIFPAAACAVVGVLSLGAIDAMDWVWPLVLIGAGAYLVLRERNKPLTPKTTQPQTNSEAQYQKEGDAAQ